MRRTLALASLSVLALSLGLAAQGPLDPALLLKPPTDAWPSYHGDYTGRHYSPLKQVNASNAKNLSLAWIYRTPASNDGADHRRIRVRGGPAGPAGAPPARRRGRSSRRCR